MTITVPSGCGVNAVCLQSDAVVLANSNTAGVTVTVTATPGSGLTISSLVLQYAPAGTSNWTTLGAKLTESGSTSTYTATLSFASFFPTGTGNYQLRAVATDSAGDVGVSAPRPDLVLVDDYAGATYVSLQAPGSIVSGTINLLAAPWNDHVTGYNQPDTITFEVSPAGANSWTTIATVAQEVDNQGNPVYVDQNGHVALNGLPAYTTPFSTATVPDGHYDFRVVAEDASGHVYVGNLVTNVLVNNAPPTVSLQSVSPTVSGVITLNASANDAVSGVLNVAFQVAPAGSGAWTTIGVVATAPYSLSFDTRGLQNGYYDLRAVATNGAGNPGDSNVVSHVSVSNSLQSNPDNLTVTDYVVPATDVSLLGAIAGSADGETWAIGYTSAPPPAGLANTYTAAAGALEPVLLRFTTATGWEIVDVLRNSDGSPFKITGNLNTASIVISGQMAASGEAWVVLSQFVNGVAQSAVFHRAPGGLFLLDPTSTLNLATVLQVPTNDLAAPQLTLGETSAGSVYGLLINPGQTQNATGAVRYGLLANVNGLPTWTSYAATNIPHGLGSVTLESASLTGSGTGWGIFAVGASGSSPLIGSFNDGAWTYLQSTGLDALDLTGKFAGSGFSFGPNLQIMAASDGIWLGVNETVPGGSGPVVALYSPSEGRVVASWCAPAVFGRSAGCSQQLDALDPAAVPDQVFETPSGPIAVSLQGGFIDIYAYGKWSAVAAPGFTTRLSTGLALTPLFTSQNSGWVSGVNALGLISATAPTAPLAQWPESNEHTLVAIALPPGGASISTSGGLAVGLDGAALHYDATQGWVGDPVPAEARAVNLLGVAFDGSSAVAVGGFGTIIDWNGTSWSLDPQSSVVTQNQLNAVAFAPDGEGWAVGAFGTILHFDGTTWSIERFDPVNDPGDVGTNITSVTVSGSQVFAVAGGNLITREPNGTWERADMSGVNPAIPNGSLTLVSGLSDGGLIVAGDSILLERQNASSPLQYADQPINGNAVALTAFRNTAGQLLAYVSVAPPVTTVNSIGGVGGFPSGDGELLLQTASGGWQDLSENQYPGTSVSGDGASEPNPVLAVAAGANGTSAWAVGGYAGTTTAGGLGSGQPLQSTPVGWQTASIWRYDAGGSATSPNNGAAQVILTAQEGVVSFAFFSSLLCEFECSSVSDAQPDSNVAGAASEISAYAQQPGGPAFAMLGGDAVGPISPAGYEAGNGAIDLQNLHNSLSLLGTVPLYAAYGPLDSVPTSADPAQPWDSAFAQSPAPFGLGQSAPGVTGVSSGGISGSVHHYYSFEASEDGGTIFVIVLDNSAGSLEASDPGQPAWLSGQLVVAQAAGLPIIVVCSEPLDTTLSGAASDGSQVAAELASAGVLAVFTTPGYTSESDRVDMVPYSFSPGTLQIPEYEGGTLGYQSAQNNGVLWYDVSVDTVGRSVSVKGIPVIQSLALQPVNGLTVARSSTLSFLGVGQRPAGSLAANGDGYENYVSIPATNCSGCIGPSYKFTSSIPGVGDFVVPSAPGSLLPLLNAQGQAVPSSSSGLFCAFNAGQTTVTVTSGLETASEVVTVLPGGFGSPCGTTFYALDENIVQIPGSTIIVSPAPASNAAPPPPAPVVVGVNLPLLPPPPPPLPAAKLTPPPAPVPVPVASFPPSPVIPLPAPVPPVILPAVVVPPIPPPVTPIPPGGATAQAAARREEKARKRAQQSAFTTRPAGTSAVDWFYPAVGLAGVVTLMLIAGGLRPGPGKRAAVAELWENEPERRRRRTRRR